MLAAFRRAVAARTPAFRALGARQLGSHSDFAKQTKVDTKDAESVESFIRTTITENPVTLFMKGTPEYPQCGFSQQVVRILHAEGVEFASVNVLEDPEVREGIKKYSEWPTIPQARRCGLPTHPPPALPLIASDCDIPMYPCPLPCVWRCSHPVRDHPNCHPKLPSGLHVWFDPSSSVRLLTLQLYIKGEFVGGCDIVTQASWRAAGMRVLPLVAALGLSSLVSVTKD
jgi:Grx4 family monothiol glutaredoxin